MSISSTDYSMSIWLRKLYWMGGMLTAALYMELAHTGALIGEQMVSSRQWAALVPTGTVAICAFFVGAMIREQVKNALIMFVGGTVFAISAGLLFGMTSQPLTGISPALSLASGWLLATAVGAAIIPLNWTNHLKYIWVLAAIIVMMSALVSGRFSWWWPVTGLIVSTVIYGQHCLPDEKWQPKSITESIDKAVSGIFSIITVPSYFLGGRA